MGSTLQTLLVLLAALVILIINVISYTYLHFYVMGYKHIIIAGQTMMKAQHRHCTWAARVIGSNRRATNVIPKASWTLCTDSWPPCGSSLVTSSSPTNLQNCTNVIVLSTTNQDLQECTMQGLVYFVMEASFSNDVDHTKQICWSAGHAYSSTETLSERLRLLQRQLLMTYRELHPNTHLQRCIDEGAESVSCRSSEADAACAKNCK